MKNKDNKNKKLNSAKFLQKCSITTKLQNMHVRHTNVRKRESERIKANERTKTEKGECESRRRKWYES